MEDTVHLKDILQLLKKKMLFILSIAVMAGLISGVVSYYAIKPSYQASAQLLVSHPAKPKQAMDMNQLQTDLFLTKSYQVMMKSPIIMDMVRNALELKESRKALGNKITVSSETDSQIIDITVSDSDPEKAVDIANTISTVFQSEVERVMNVNNVSVFNKASVADSNNQSGSSPMMNVIIAVVVGLMAGVGLVFFIEYLDNSTKRKKEIEKLLELPVIAVIPDMNQDRRFYKSVQKQQPASQPLGAKGGKTVES